MNGDEPDRVGFTDADFFAETIDRWHEEGLPVAVDTKGIGSSWLNVNGLKHFGMDVYVMWADLTPKYDVIEYETSNDWTIMKDEFGTTTKCWTRKSVTPQYLDPIVKTPEDFIEKVEPLLDSIDKRRVSSPQYPFKRQLNETVQRMQKEFCVLVGMTGPFEYSMHLCGGLAPTLMFMMKNQDFTSYMFGFLADFLTKIGESYIEAGADGLWLFDDLGAQAGPFYSPKLYAKLLMPAHERVCEPFKRKSA